MLGFSLAVALGRGGCGEIIPGTAEWSRHQTHREKWITPTGRDSNKLEGWSVGSRSSSPDKSAGEGAGLQEGIRKERRRGRLILK